MTWCEFFALFSDRELTNQVFHGLDNRRFDRVYRHVIKRAVHITAPVYLSLLQCIGMLTTARRQDIEQKLNESENGES